MKILVFPQDVNPYQHQLYSSLERQYTNIEYLDVSSKGKLRVISYTLRLILTMTRRRLRGFRILHVHWLYTFELPSRIPFAHNIAYANTLIFLKSARLLGYKIVWTVHNVLPHEPLTNNDISLMRIFSRISDAKIIHSAYTLKQMQTMKLDTSQTTIIPHGNYVKVYKTSLTQKEARIKLGLVKDELVVLFFGQIRSYKGLDDLLDAFAKISQPKTRLVIAGKCKDKKIKDKIIKAQSSFPVDFYNKFIPDNEVELYFMASDLVSLPFKSITTSGSALLALSFGRPIVAPRLGTLADLPDNVGYFYDRSQPHALYMNLQKALNNKARLKELGSHARIYAGTFSWKKIADKTYGVYEEVLSRSKK